MRFPTRIKAIKTKADGIIFRSRLEATWYLFLKKAGYDVTYEPEVFEIIGHENISMGLYTPDFFIEPDNVYVEIKPDMEKYPFRDRASMSKAMILGITHPTVIVQGSPFKYKAFLAKGELPREAINGTLGDTVMFGLCGIDVIDSNVILEGCIPSKYGLDDWVDPRELNKSYRTPGRLFQPIAAESWNETAWRM